jgi:BirA family transcriptional regulator, biotin operon repressor / biotin---[acetyl-CoA-carboxylase] ligase
MKFDVNWLNKTESTNTFLSDMAKKNTKLPSGTLVAAHHQTAGRGRSARSWVTQPNTNLCFSIFAESACAPIELPSLTMATALGINQLLTDHQIPAAPKWPNDIQVGNRKICGILSERADRGIIIGIGLNVNMTDEETRLIDRPATSMLIESGRTNHIEQILHDLLPYLSEWIEHWQSGGFSAIQEAWTIASGPIGRPLTVHDGDCIKTGNLAGYGPHGQLLLNTASGLEIIWSGDVLNS